MQYFHHHYTSFIDSQTKGSQPAKALLTACKVQDLVPPLIKLYRSFIL